MDVVPVTVVVPARDAASTLPSLLEGLRLQDLAKEAFEVVLVDDGSLDATAALARSAGYRVVDGGGRGPAAARNAGAEVARGRVLAFVDADCVPARGWLSAGLAAIGDGAELVQGRVLPDPAAARGPWDRTIGVERASPLFQSANVFITAEIFALLGGFESWLGTATAKELGEDAWLGRRAVRAGVRTGFAPGALVHHAVFPRGPGGYVAERARLRFFPALARRIPELRGELFHRGVFLTRRSARFDAALAGAAVLTIAGARRRHLVGGEDQTSPRWAGTALALPYATIVARDARARGVKVAAVEVAADAVSFGALVFGSLRERSPLL